MANTKITTNVIADDAVTSDKLGGDLTMPGHVSLADNKELRIGTGNDFVIKHDASHTTLTNTTGNFTLLGDAVYIGNAANNEYLAQFIANGAASLRYDNTEQLATISGGVYIPNKLGIGTNSPASYYADNLVVAAPDEGGITIASSATTHRGIMAFADATSGDGRYAGYLAYDHNTDGMTLHSGGAGAKRVEIDSAGTLKVGAVVPTPGSGWDANLDAIQVGEASAFRSGDTDYSAATYVSTNLYQTGGGDKLLNGSDYATQYLQQGGNHYFYGYNNGSADATPAVATNDLANPLIIYKGGGISLSGGSVGNTVNGKSGIFWHGNPTDGADYCIRRTNDAWSGSNYAQLLIDWDTGVKIDVGNSAYGKSYLEVNGNVKFSASGQGIDFSATGSGTSTSGQAHVLDEYEFGSWTPTCHTGSATFVSPYYIKIGRVVHFSFQVHQFTDTSTASSIDIRGLPFPCLVGQAAGTVFGIYLDHEVDSVYVNTAEEIFFYELTNSGWYAARHSDINSTSAYFYVGGTYITSS